MVVPVWKSSLGSGGSMPLFVNIFVKTFMGLDKDFVQISWISFPCNCEAIMSITSLAALSG